MRPAISVVMANYRGAAHLDAAIRSVRRQSLAEFELLLSDDASTDDSLVIARSHAAEDPRVRVIEAPANGGPGAARNRALDAARGEWIAIVDSDDLIHPQRLERMRAAAMRLGVDMIADDLVFFGEAPSACGRTLLEGMDLRAPLEVDTRLLLRAHGGDATLPPLGYLKPMIRAAALDGLRYDTNLRIGEDYDLYLRLLLAGTRCALIPDPMYLYRRHSGSISHRLSLPVVQAMIAAHDRLPPPADAAEARERRVWRSLLEKQQHYEELVALLKARRLAKAAPLMLRPAMLRRLVCSLGERLTRREAPAERSAAVVHLSAPPPSDAPLAIAFPLVPAPGAAWRVPPAPAAAALSALSTRHDLRPLCHDATGEWAQWLLPSVHATAPAPLSASGER